MVVGWVVVGFVVVGFVVTVVVWSDVLADGLVVAVVVVSGMVETVVVTGGVSSESFELRSAEAGRAEANTRAAPAAMVPQPAATLRRDARGGVGAVLMVPPSCGRQPTCRTPQARGRLSG